MNGVLNGFSYPIYAVDFIGGDSIVVAGGGGAVKTGVSNRVDVVSLSALTGAIGLGSAISPVTVKVDGGVDTGTEAVMNLTVASAGSVSFVMTLEGHNCVEYLARLTKVTSTADLEVKQSQTELDDEINVLKRTDRNNDCVRDCPSKSVITSPRTDMQVPHKWELIKIRCFSIPPIYDGSSQPFDQYKHFTGTGLPTSVTSGGRAGSLLAIGTDLGSVFLIDRHAKPTADWTPFVYPDVSVGSSAGVCSLSLTSSSTPDQSDTSSTHSSLLAVVCDQPSWSHLSVWRADGIRGDDSCLCTDLPLQHPHVHLSRDCSRSGESSALHNRFSPEMDGTYCSNCRIRSFPYALASCSSCLATCFRSPNTPEFPSAVGCNYRFKHCQFLQALFDCPSDFFPGITVSPSAHMLATTVQPLRVACSSVSRLVIWLVPMTCHLDNFRAIHLPVFAEVRLPRDHLPACLASHPNPQRRLIGVGTMKGRVDVYFLSCFERSLTQVYSMDNAHPIFVTTLAFLPLSSKSTTESCLQDTSFQLVTASVDRALRWHFGPSYIRIGRLTRDLRVPEVDSSLISLGHSMVASSARLVTIFSIPILLTLIDAFLIWNL